MLVRPMQRSSVIGLEVLRLIDRHTIDDERPTLSQFASISNRHLINQHILYAHPQLFVPRDYSLLFKPPRTMDDRSIQPYLYNKLKNLVIGAISCRRHHISATD